MTVKLDEITDSNRVGDRDSAAGNNALLRVEARLTGNYNVAVSETEPVEYQLCL